MSERAWACDTCGWHEVMPYMVRTEDIGYFIARVVRPSPLSFDRMHAERVCIWCSVRRSTLDERYAAAVNRYLGSRS